jgi:hypothetical protein
MVYVSINKEFFEKHKTELEAESIANGDENGFLHSDEMEGEVEEISDESICVKCDNDIGYISMDVKLTTEDWINLMELAVKKLNKFKTVLEGLK